MKTESVGFGIWAGALEEADVQPELGSLGHGQVATFDLVARRDIKLASGRLEGGHMIQCLVDLCFGISLLATSEQKQQDHRDGGQGDQSW